MSQVVQFARAEGAFEVELGADELLTLAQSPAGTMRPADAVQVEKGASPADGCCSRMAFGIGAAIALAVLTGLTLYRPASIAPPVPDVAMMLPESPSVAAHISPQPVKPPVRFANPFDRTEVFEFPAGTSRAEARRKVSQLLIERAHGRGPAPRRMAAAHSAGVTSRR